MSAMSNPEVARSELPLYNSASTPPPQTQAEAEVLRAAEIASVHSSHSASDKKELYGATKPPHPTGEAHASGGGFDAASDSSAAAALYARENGLDVDVPKTGGIGHVLSRAIHSKAAIYVRDFGMIALIFAWWLPGMINDDPRVRHKRIPNSILAWFFILLILLHDSKYIPQRPIVRVLVTIWMNVFARPWSMLPHIGKLIVGWLSLAVLVFGTTYGLPVVAESSLGERTISLAGVVLIYGMLFMFSSNHKAVQVRTVVLGIGFQFIIALFVFRTGAGYSLFEWIALAAADLLKQGQLGGAAFFWRDLVDEGYFFINVLSSIIFFVALTIALFYCGALGWCIKKAAWFAHAVFGISGGEAVVAVASPFIGQGENCVLVRPFVKSFTRSELHQVLVSGFAAIAGSVLIAYIGLGVSGRDLITSSVMSIPASIAASKIRYPETQHSYTAGRVTVAAQDEDGKASDVFHALSNGAWFGLRVAGLILANVLVIVSVLYTINGLLTYIGRNWYITEDNGPLTLQLILSYVLWPLAFMLGVPARDCLRVAELIGLKVVANEFVAYNELQTVIMPNEATRLGPRAYLIAKYALCGFGNIGSLGINLGILAALAPKRAGEIVRLLPSALLTGILVTLSSAAIAGIVGDPLLDPYVPPSTSA